MPENGSDKKGHAEDADRGKKIDLTDFKGSKMYSFAERGESWGIHISTDEKPLKEPKGVRKGLQKAEEETDQKVAADAEHGRKVPDGGRKLGQHKWGVEVIGVREERRPNATKGAKD